jgi:aminobutyraldehyde dehydrogenase
MPAGVFVVISKNISGVSMSISQEKKDALLLARAADIANSATFGHVINGISEDNGSGKSIAVLNPSNGERIAQIISGTAGDVDRAVTAARGAFVKWKGLQPSQRNKVLNAVADALDANLDDLAALESLNAGKPWMVSRAEIGMGGDIFRFLAGAARAMQAPATEEYVSGYVSMIRREPVGVVGAITPWNYPLLTAVFKIAGALAAGNTMVLKPSELTPLTTIHFMKLVADILPPGVLNIVLGSGSVVGSAISQHPDIDLVSITGSVASGQRVVIDSAKSLKPTHLELGGKAPVVVFEDADLERVAQSVRTGGFWNSGQECGAATRVLCAASIKDRLTALLIEQISSIRTGAVTEGADIEMGPLISKRHLDSVAAMVSQAKLDGATIALGGEVIPGPGYFYSPTVITDIAHGSEITREEIFGPVITIETFDDEADAINKANDVAYGLCASVWTQNVGRSLRMSSALNFGTVWTNTHLVLPVEMPWGGFNASGHGRELSTLSLDDFSRTKHVMIAISADQ